MQVQPRSTKVKANAFTHLTGMETRTGSATANAVPKAMLGSGLSLSSLLDTRLSLMAAFTKWARCSCNKEAYGPRHTPNSQKGASLGVLEGV